MAGLTDTLATLQKLRAIMPGRVAGRARETAFAPNPGTLRMLAYVPPGLARGAPLVVVLHGCMQDGAGYEAAAGWSTLADRAGFAVLAPEQARANNQNACFNWFEPGDITRGQGEVASIAAMVARMQADHGIDRTRVFATGLSAGGAMTAALIACYPELFAGAAIIAGLPFGAARSVASAMQAMRQPPAETAVEWGDRVRAASPHRGPWPRVSIWTGAADHTVQPGNADALAQQWTNVHGLSGPSAPAPMAGATRLVWQDRAGRAAVEKVVVPGLGHGTPIDPAESGIGAPAPFVLASGVSSTERIAGFFGLVPERAESGRAAAGPRPGVESPAGLVARMLRMAKLPGL